MKFVMRIFNDARQLICFYVTHICMYFFYLVQNFIEWSNLFFPLHSVSMKSARVVSSAFIALVPTTIRLVFFSVLKTYSFHLTIIGCSMHRHVKSAHLFTLRRHHIIYTISSQVQTNTSGNWKQLLYQQGK